MLTDEELGVRLRTRLHDELAAVTAPSDLTDSLRRRARRVTVARAGLVAGLAVVAAAGGVAAISGHRPGQEPGAGSTEALVYDVSYVAEQTDGALAKATDFVLRAEYTIESTGYSYVDLVDLLTHRTRIDSSGPGGPAYSHLITPDPGGRTETVVVVDHSHRAWWSHSLELPAAPDGTVTVYSTPQYHDPAEIRDALNSGELTLVGQEDIGGRDAWHLRTDVYRLDLHYGTLDIYVDPQTYLPMRIVTTRVVGAANPVAVTDLTWLPRTAENLALLEVAIPDGYTHQDTPVVPEPGQPVG